MCPIIYSHYRNVQNSQNSELSCDTKMILTRDNRSQFKSYNIWNLPSNGKELHEITTPTTGTKFIVDLDYDAKAKTRNMTAHFYRIISLVISATRFNLYDVFNVEVSDSDFVVLNASRSKKIAQSPGSAFSFDRYKYSFHIILPGYYFPELPALKKFMDEIHRCILGSIHPDLKRCFDMGIYRDNDKTGSMRIPFTSKTGAEGSKLTPMKYMPKMIRCPVSLDGNDVSYDDVDVIHFKDRELSEMLLSLNETCCPLINKSWYSENSKRADTDKIENDILPDNVKAVLLKNIPNLEMTKNNTLIRTQPGYCQVCKRDHNQSDAYFIYKGGCLYLKCFRSKGSKWLYGTNKMNSLNETSVIGKLPEFKTPNIIKFNNKYCQEFPDVKTLAVRSPMGSGKTVQLKRVLAEHSDKRILILSFRKSFTIDIANNTGFKSYLNTKNIKEEPRLIIQVDSLGKIAGCNYDILICDEIESIIEQMSSSQIRHKPRVFSVFKSLWRHPARLYFLMPTYQLALNG